MANVVKRNAPAPALPGMADDRHVAALVGSFVIEEVGRNVTLDRLPDREERRLLQERNVELSKLLRPAVTATAELQTARQHLATLFGGYTSLRNADVDDLLSAYLLVLQSYPIGSIISAVMDVAHNRYPDADPNWPPTSPMMARRAADHVAKLAAEQIRIEKILRARNVMQAPRDPGAGERVMASLQDFNGRMAGGRLFGMMTDEERRRARSDEAERARDRLVREWHHLGLQPRFTQEGQPMSVAMARKLGLIREEARDDRFDRR